MAGFIGLANYKVLSFKKISSTQNYALRMIETGRAADQVAVVAETQTAGRGRYRRRWVSRGGNLFVSFIYDCAKPDARVSYAVAVAVAETVAEFGAPAKIKWPNDVLVDGKKISGVLIEYAGDFVVVGIGINIAHAPRVEKYETACLADYGDATPNAVLGRLMKNLDRWMAADFTVVRLRWMGYAARLSDTVIYQGAPATFCGIAGDGAIVLCRDDKEFRVYGDEITF